MSIVIFGDLFTFPEGAAATNRVYTYAKGFIENGLTVHVVCTMNFFSNSKEGVIDGIVYHVPFTHHKRSRFFLVRRWQTLLKYIDTYFILRKINKADNIVAINSWSNLLLTHMFGFAVAKICGAKFIVECSEHPLRYYTQNFFKRAQGRIKFFLETSMSDGILCISHFLVDFHKSKGVEGRKLFLVPSTVDPHRFDRQFARPMQNRYIGYFGSLTFDRDNVDILIKAFAKFHHLHPDVQLVLGGICNDEEKKQILELIKALNIQSKARLLGYLSREEILEYVSNAEVLVMVRSNDIHTQASYPSKLTEFLASSRPVISVEVGEIPLYLKDGADVFLVEPGNVDALAEKLEYVFNNYELAVQVGKQGKRLTETVFNYKYQAKRMVEFINSP